MLSAKSLLRRGAAKNQEQSTLKLWDGLTLFLEDGNVPLDNNGTERVLRGVVLGRKNHYGSKSERGTKVAAILYSLIESAKLAGVEPRDYLLHAIGEVLENREPVLPHQFAAIA